MSDYFVDITSSFLKEFDTHWKIMLDELECSQIQLREGNRLRPQICLWGYLSTIPNLQSFSGDLSRIASVSVSLEMIHKASILIDDWIDGDRVRHGKPAFHVEYSPQDAILIALNIIGLSMVRLKKIFLQASSIVLPYHYFMCFDTLLNTIYSMARGALKELQLSGTEFFDCDKIRNIMQLETAEMLGNCLLFGYYAGTEKDNVNPAIVNSFKQIGDQCGFLFQVMNDMEAFSSPEKLSIHKGNLNLDVLRQRKNYGVSVLYELAKPFDKKLLENSLSDYLLPLMKKYQVMDVITRQLQVVYKDVNKEVCSLADNGVSIDWCTGFQAFWEYIKKCGEDRLKA